MAISSIRKIAERVNVSAATVSRVLNGTAEISEETRSKVLSAAKAANYVGSVGRRVTTNIGLVFAAKLEFCPFDALLVSGMMRGLEEHKYDFTVINLERDKRPNENYTQFFLRKGVRGVIVRSPMRSRHVCEAIAAEGFPQVVIAERFEDPLVNYIRGSSLEASRRAVSHLLQLGHKRIAYGTHFEPDADHDDRFQGYQQALKEAGIPLEPSLVVQLVATFQGGVTAFNELMSMQHPPTAFFFADPMPAVGAMRRANLMGLRVPEDLSIIAVDDSAVRTDVYPTMTAVVQSVPDLGFEAALWLTRHLVHHRTKDSLRREMPARFEVNSTTGAPPSQVIRILPDGSKVPAV